MLMHFLTRAHQVQFLKIATLVSLIEKPAIDWSGQLESEYPDGVVGDFRNIQESEQEKRALDAFIRECGMDTSRSSMYLSLIHI